MAWLLDVRDGDKDLYPEIKARAAERNRRAREGGEKHDDMVRYEIMRLFGYYVTESSEHNAEYTPFWIKSQAPDLVEQYNIPLDEYPRRCETQIADWAEQKSHILHGDGLEHERSVEYAATIVGALLQDEPARIHGNVLNRGLITNLPEDAVVEVPVLVDGNGLNPTKVGQLPTQCAALNRTNTNVHSLTIEAALERSRERVYQAALLDPHTAAELPPDRIVAMCDELFEAHREWLPEYR
jgi:alpha-galactosidase